MKTETGKLKEVLKDYLIEKDSNHWIRRFFRCYIDGSYKGAEHYKANCEYIKEHKDTFKRMRSFVISSFVDFLAIEFTEIKRGTVHNAIKDTLSSAELEELNKELIEDSLELIEELV